MGIQTSNIKHQKHISKFKNFWILICRFGICSLIFGFSCGCQKHLYKDTRVMMGTYVEVVSADREAGGIVFSEIKRIEGLLSKYDPVSEVSRLNSSGKLRVSPETFYILKKSRELWEVSGGAFDITVAPLVDLWGFTDKKYTVPAQGSIKDALQLVGTDKIVLHDGDNVVEFQFSGMKIDLGAIAKGYALDCAVDKLKKSGIMSCLINAGGQIYCLGGNWKVAIQNPSGRGLSGILQLKNRAIATSGGYEQYFTKDNHRYCHIFDPKTGYPVDSKLYSVTVIASDGLTADALATAIFVLGKERGEALAKMFPGVEIKIIKDKNV